jgi:adenylate cyclase
MAEERVQRRLAAILAADVVGYSRLMGEDETGTLDRLKALRQDVLDPKITEFGGRIVKTMGDGFLVEFASAVDAVRSALSFQSSLAERNATVSGQQRLVFRVGINLGDVIIEEDDIHGDGVNVAARLEGLCEPGEVYVSGTVREHVEGKLDAHFDNLGEQTVKNIARAIPIFRARFGATAGERPDTTASDREPTKPSVRPSIAVLSFANMSGDPEQEYFSDGISEDIITALSHIRWFLVIARNSSFSYKGTSPDIRQVAKELGVRYVLEGSVRKAGNRVRITPQLIDADNGSHIWAERYDRELEDIFTVQDEITQTVVGAIEPELSRAEQERARLKPPENLGAWDFYQRGQWHFNRITPDDLSRAKSMFQSAIDLDPSLGAAYSGLATACFYEFILGVALSQSLVEPAYEAARKAIEIDANDPIAKVALGLAYQLEGKQAESIPHLEAAIALNPSLARGHYYLGAALTFSGRGKDAISHLETAIRLSPRDPWMAHFMARLSEAHLFTDSLDDAVTWGRKARSQSGPWAWTARLGLVAALGHLGLLDEAQIAFEEMRVKRPDVSSNFVRMHFPIENDANKATLLEGLRKAGLPE